MIRKHGGGALLSEAQAEHPFFEGARAATERVRAKIEDDLRAVPGITFLLAFLGGATYGAAQRLIDAKRRSGVEVPMDEAVILHCSRLFTECLAGYELLVRGLTLPATAVVRSVLEVSMQAVMLMGDPDRAVRWLDGKRYSPGDVRSAIESDEGIRERYRALSSIVHANVEATLLHTTPIADVEGTMLAYGGSFRPRAAAGIACDLLDAQLFFLRSFYSFYSSRLDELGLLWRPEMLDMLGNAAPPDATSWGTMFEGCSRILADSRSTIDSWPDDDDELGRYGQTLAQIPSPFERNDTGSNAP